MAVAEQLLTSGEAARAIGVSTVYLRRLADDGRIPGVTVTRYGRLYDADAVRTLAAERTARQTKREQAENNRDRTAKGREYDRRGERNPRAKLTEQDIREIRELQGKGISQQTIAARFNVPQPSISCIWLGKTWKHVV